MERFTFRTWHVWMDPHAHVNHAAYVDFCDEGTSRLVARQGVDPQSLSPVAEVVHFRAAIGADQEVTVETALIGRQGDVAVFTHRLLSGAQLCATGTTFRRCVHPGGWPGSLR